MRRRRADFFDGKACAHCGSYERLELDHVDPTKKVTHRVWSWSAKRRAVEIAKCQVLCHACHLAKTAHRHERVASFAVIEAVRRERERGDLYRDIAARHGVSETTAKRIVYRQGLYAEDESFVPTDREQSA